MNKEARRLFRKQSEDILELFYDRGLSLAEFVSVLLDQAQEQLDNANELNRQERGAAYDTEQMARFEQIASDARRCGDAKRVFEMREAIRERDEKIAALEAKIAWYERLFDLFARIGPDRSQPIHLQYATALGFVNGVSAGALLLSPLSDEEIAEIEQDAAPMLRKKEAA